MPDQQSKVSRQVKESEVPPSTKLRPSEAVSKFNPFFALSSG